MKRALAVVALSLAAACGGSSSAPSAGLSSPTAIVPFRGFSAQRPGELRRYLAVAANRTSEIRLLDPENNRPILGPTRIFPLSVATEGRPLRLASAPIDADGADLLVVASAGGPVGGGAAVELVVTWQDENRIGPAIQVAPGVAGALITALAAGAVPGTPGRARLAVGLSTPAGGQLALLDFGRGDAGAVVLAAAPVLTPLAAAAGPFTPVDLAFSPDGALLFAATPDPLAASPEGPVHGVAQIALAADPTAIGAVTVLDARAPTTQVAAAIVAERVVEAAPLASPDVFPGSGELRVYAALDPAGCGETRAIRCGVVTLAPGVGLAPDPSAPLAPTRAMPYRAPFDVAGVPLDVAPAGPPQARFADSTCDPASLATLRLTLSNGEQRCTSAVAAVPSSDGNVYLADLGRFGFPSERATVGAATTRTRVSSASSTSPGGTPELGLLGPAGFTADPAGLAAALAVSPGFTPTDRWTLTWQGTLPGLAAARGVVLRTGGALYLGGQVDSGGRGPAGEIVWQPLTRLASIELGVAAGDLVELTTDQPISCGGAAAITAVGEATVAATPDPALASALLPAGGIPLTEGCWSQGLAEGAARSVTFTIRTSGLLLASEGQGYLGRPALNARVDGALGYRLEWTPEADPGAAPAPATEVQLLARKARRRFYPAQYAGCGAGCEGFPGLVDPLAPGPMIAFTPVALRPLARGSALAFTTDAGYQPYARRPSGAVLPVAAAAVDRSALPGGEGKLEIRYYVAYSADEVFVFGPGEASGSAFVIR